MNRPQREILMHATGLDRTPEPHRRYFATGPRGADYADAMELVDAGFFSPGAAGNPDIFPDTVFFYVTVEGFAEAGKARKIIDLADGVSRSLEWLKRRPRAREAFAGKPVRIHSGQWGQWWMPDGNGYTSDVVESGVYQFEDAWGRSSHCGPEKKIRYVQLRKSPKRKRTLVDA